MADGPIAKRSQSETVSDGVLFVFEDKAIPAPPGTTSPQSRWQQFRVAVPGNEPAAAEVVAELIGFSAPSTNCRTIPPGSKLFGVRWLR